MASTAAADAVVPCSKLELLSIDAYFKTPEATRAFESHLTEAGDTGASYHIAPLQRSAAPSSFDGSRYMQRLHTKRLGHVLLSAKELPSTQDFMRSNNARLGGNIVMVADRQAAGKGRGGNLWTSPEGCLMFTAGCPVKIVGSQAPFINYVVCLALVMGVRDCLEPLLQGAPLDVRIKWPNDVYSGGLKIAGALIHTTWSKDRFNVLTGIGLNVSNPQPTRCLQDVIVASLEAAGRAVDDAPAVQREDVLAAIVNRLEEYFDVFQAHGFGPLEALYLDNWLHSGQRVGLESGTLAADSRFGQETRTAAAGATSSTSPPAANCTGRVDQPESSSARDEAEPALDRSPPSSPVQLTIRGLSADGFLLAEDEAGRRYELTPDGNSLDMMQGLLRRKLP